MPLASGNRASLRWTRETNGTLGTKNVEPPALTTPASITSSATGGTGEGDFTLTTTAAANGIVPGQTVLVSGDTTTAHNGYWKVKSVSGSTITVFDPTDAITGTTSGASMAVSLTTLRATGRNVNLEKDTLESAEADADGMETDSRHGFNRVVGSPGYQLSLKDFDDILEMGMANQWIEVTLSGTHAGSVSNTITKTGGSGWDGDGVRVGDILKVTGSGAGEYVVLTVASSSVITVGKTDGTAASLPTSALTVSFPGKRLDMGTDVDTMTLERAFLDIDTYQRWHGCAVDSFQFTVSPEAMVNGTINILGMSADAVVNGTPVTVPASAGLAPMAAFDGALYEGGAAQAVVTSFDLTANRNRSLNAVVGSKFSPDVWEGQATTEGTISAYFGDDATLFNKFIDETESWLNIVLRDPNDLTQFISITVPRIKYNGAGMDPPTQGPVTMDMPFKALKATGLVNPGSTTVNTALTIQRSNEF